MNFKSQIGVTAHPDLRLRTRLEKLDFVLHGDARVSIATGTIRAEVGEVPLRLAIPFHRHRRVVAGSVGPFRVTVHPIEATLHITDIRATGTLGGAEGIAGELHCQGNCSADVSVTAEAPGKLKAAFESVFDE